VIWAYRIVAVEVILIWFFMQFCYLLKCVEYEVEGSRPRGRP